MGPTGAGAIVGGCFGLVLLILRDLGRGVYPLRFWLNLVSGRKNLTSAARLTMSLMLDVSLAG